MTDRRLIEYVPDTDRPSKRRSLRTEASVRMLARSVPPEGSEHARLLTALKALRAEGWETGWWAEWRLRDEWLRSDRTMVQSEGEGTPYDLYDASETRSMGDRPRVLWCVSTPGRLHVDEEGAIQGSVPLSIVPPRSVAQDEAERWGLDAVRQVMVGAGLLMQQYSQDHVCLCPELVGRGSIRVDDALGVYGLADDERAVILDRWHPGRLLTEWLRRGAQVSAVPEAEMLRRATPEALLRQTRSHEWNDGRKRACRLLLAHPAATREQRLAGLATLLRHPDRAMREWAQRLAGRTGGQLDRPRVFRTRQR